MDKKKVLSVLILGLILFELGMSISLAYENWQRSEVLCVIGESCTSVQESIYGEILGIKVSYMAVVAFLGLLVIYFVNSKLFLYGTAAGVIASLYFIALQIFVLKEICTSCMFIDGTMIVIFVLTLLNFKLNKK